MLATCLRVVPSATTNSPEIWLLLLPWARRRKTSTSRCVRPPGREVVNKLKTTFRILFAASQKGPENLDASRREIEKRGAACDEVTELLEFMKRSRDGRFGRQAQAPPGVDFREEGKDKKDKKP